MTDGNKGSRLYERIYQTVRQIPPGQVASYGRIARMVKTGARQVGYAMAALEGDRDVPWHRVINSRGEISPRKDGNSDERQRQLLLSEGVIFDARGRVDFDRYGWIEDDFPWADTV